MANINLSSMENITFNGYELEKVIFNGFEVWTKETEPPHEIIKLNPIMTSNIAPSGVAYSKSYYNDSTRYPWRAFDGNNTNCYTCSVNAIVSDQYLVYRFQYVDTITKFSFTPVGITAKAYYDSTYYFDFLDISVNPTDLSCDVISTISVPVTASQSDSIIEINLDAPIKHASAIRVRWSGYTNAGTSSTSNKYVSLSELDLFGYHEFTPEMYPDSSELIPTLTKDSIGIGDEVYNVTYASRDSSSTTGYRAFNNDTTNGYVDSVSSSTVDSKYLKIEFSNYTYNIDYLTFRALRNADSTTYLQDVTIYVDFFDSDSQLITTESFYVEKAGYKILKYLVLKQRVEGVKSIRLRWSNRMKYSSSNSAGSGAVHCTTLQAYGQKQ